MSSIRSAHYSWRKQTCFWAACLSKAAALQLNLSWCSKRYYLFFQTSHCSYPQILVFLSWLGRRRLFSFLLSPTSASFSLQSHCCRAVVLLLLLDMVREGLDEFNLLGEELNLPVPSMG